MNKLSVVIDNKEVELLTQKITGQVWFHYQGETFNYIPVTQQNHGAGAGASEDPTKIVAPMPGKIIKVLVQQGQLVSEGETLVVMEAMKMEYNLKSVHKMKVTKINAAEGAQVSLGELLVELEEE